MADSMSITQLPLTLIVAATTKNGIGRNGGLPWPMLKKDMGYFARVTKRVPMPTQTGSLQSDQLKEKVLNGVSRNVVIMGRKTWDSIPSKFRPLQDRTNIVISSQDRSKLESIPPDVIVASDITSALTVLEDWIRKRQAMPTQRLFVIGGSSIYKAALDMPQTNRILLTRILKDYECDTFFPVALGGHDVSRSSSWLRASDVSLEEFVKEKVDNAATCEEVDGGSIPLEFQLWEREP